MTAGACQTLPELYLSPNGQDPLKTLDSKVKAALTREYNKGTHKSQGLAHSTVFKVSQTAQAHRQTQHTLGRGP